MSSLRFRFVRVDAIVLNVTYIISKTIHVRTVWADKRTGGRETMLYDLSPFAGLETMLYDLFSICWWRDHY